MGQDGTTERNTNARYGGIVAGSSLADVIARPNVFDGVVINVAWADLQPSPGALETAPIETMLAEMRRYNRDPRITVKLRAILRVWAGGAAPEWAKAIGGPPLTAYVGRPAHYRPYTLGRFWSPNYMRAWRQLQDSLAARYDSEPLIAQISDTSCTSDTDEPGALARFQDRAAGLSTIRVLHEAGYSDAAYERCMADAVQDYAGWKLTSVNITFNPMFRLDSIADYGQPPRDAAFTATLMAQWRRAFGDRAVLANHNLNYPLPPRNEEIYEAIRQQGGQIEFQTHAPGRLDWPNTVKEAVCLGAHSLEIWNSTNMGGFVDFPVATLMEWANELKHTTSNELCPG